MIFSAPPGMRIRRAGAWTAECRSCGSSYIENCPHPEEAIRRLTHAHMEHECRGTRSR